MAGTPRFLLNLVDGEVRQFQVDDQVQLIGPINYAAITTVASASVMDFANTTSNHIRITGSTTITSFGAGTSGMSRKVVFSVGVKMVHDPAKIILPGSVDIFTTEFDSAEFVSEGSELWRCISYTRGNTIPSIDLSGYIAKSYAVANGGSTTLGLLGIAITAAGTATSITITSTDKFTLIRKIAYRVTVAATNAVASFRNGTLSLLRGNSAGFGGFCVRYIVGMSTGITNTSHRFFCGLRGTIAAPSDVDPSSQISVFGFGYDSGDTNIQLMHNDGSGIATKVNLGASFPKPSVDESNMFEIMVWCKPNDSHLHAYIRDMISGDVVYLSANTNIPSNIQLLGQGAYLSVGGVSSVIGIHLSIIETGTNH